MKTPVLITVRGGNHEKRLVTAAAANALKTGNVVVLEREPSNPHDSNAIKCFVMHPVYAYPGAREDGKDPVEMQQFDIGYVAREIAHVLAPELDRGADYTAVLKSWSSASCIIDLLTAQQYANGESSVHGQD